MLTLERLMQLATYDPETGIFTRLSGQYRIKAGSVMGRKHHQGYFHVRIDKKVYQCHRLAWLYFYGEWPKHDVDHINGDRSDNRIANLRDVPHNINMQNRHHTVNDGGRLIGTRKQKNGNWIATIGVNGKSKHIGTFKTMELAHVAYMEEKRKHHPGFTR